MIPDDMLRAAADKTSRAYTDAMERDFDPARQHTFSDSFHKRLKKIRRRADHPRWYSIRQYAASFALMTLLGGTVWLTVDVDARATFLGWVRETYKTYFVCHADQNSAADLGCYRLGWLPVGYTEFFTEDSQNEVFMVYSNQDGQKLKFRYTSNISESDWFIDISQMETKQVLVNGKQADLLVSTDVKTASAILWFSEDGTAFYLSGYLSEDELIRVAENIQKIN